MKQYAQVKAKYPDTILLFRMGDFYETFEEDAKTTSSVLGITLTRRGNGAAGEIPLAGFPYHALDSYLPKLLKAGHRVAICEQLEDPKFAKGIVKRDVIEVMTPGVAFSDRVLEHKQNNYLAAIHLPSPLATGDDRVGLALIDVSTADFNVTELPIRSLADQIAAVGPSEILVQKRDLDTLRQLLRTSFKGLVTRLDDWIFNFDYAYELLINHFKTQSLKGFGLEEMSSGIVAAGAIMNYLQETQKSNLLHIRRIAPFNTGEYIFLDQSTKRNLEITRSVEGREEGTLFWVLDQTRTSMGARMLKKWVNQPLRTVGPIRRRHEAVTELVTTRALRGTISGILGGFGDLERLIARICTNRANPRDVHALRSMLVLTEKLKESLAGTISPALAGIREALTPLEGLVQTIGTALVDDPPLALSDGGIFRNGYNKELDELRDIALNGKNWIALLQKTERERTGIPSLKVSFNNVFGYYIEITNTHREKVPEGYIRKQTMTNAERYITPELKEYEDKILHAEERILALETGLFTELRLLIAAQAEAIQRNASLIAELDCLMSFAIVASESGYVLPVINEESTIQITGGRHPVIERLLPPGEQYTPNDVLLTNDDRQIMIITGPNMSGKSSYLRQAGLIVLLAQIGSYVPALSATIGIVDRIYTRVGASDNISSGESTFLVEMHEAANIINTATARSLILLDEVGRGTSTFDGISIAWALTEYIHNRIGAKTLFATHYHELNELSELLPRIRNLKVEVREYGDRVIFLHKVSPGFADHSYGIQVAQMAGLPDEVTERAKGILRNLEGSELLLHGDGAPAQAKGRVAPAELQMTLFEMRDDPLRVAIEQLDLENMTPLEALHTLAELKKRTSS
jgi:DNA mismatch repair protein MutS